jgi:cytochrome c biogenesis protein CcmG, thiol:disulfide interchange protein DsbE
MKRVNRIHKIPLLAGLALTFLLAGCGGQVKGAASKKTTSISVGATPHHLAPSFSLPAFSDTSTTTSSVSLAQLLGHKTLLLNAWASWCEYCQVETPDLVQADKTYASSMSIVGIDMTGQEQDVNHVRTFVKQYGIRYPILLDPKGDFLNSYNVVGLPTSFLVSPSGEILATKVGALSKAELAQWAKMARSANAQTTHQNA